MSVGTLKEENAKVQKALAARNREKNKLHMRRVSAVRRAAKETEKIPFPIG